MKDVDGRAQRLAQADGAGAQEQLRVVMPDGAQQLVELLRLGEGEHDQLRARQRGVGGNEALPVGQPGDRVAPCGKGGGA